jgi:hypothetical protein
MGLGSGWWRVEGGWMDWMGDGEMASEHAFSTTLLLLCRLGYREEDDKKRKRTERLERPTGRIAVKPLGDMASSIFPVRLYKYISIPYILSDWAFLIAADGLPVSQKVRLKYPPYF